MFRGRIAGDYVDSLTSTSKNGGRGNIFQGIPPYELSVTVAVAIFHLLAAKGG